MRETGPFRRGRPKVFGRYVAATEIEAFRLELIRAGIVSRDAQAPYEAGRRCGTSGERT